MNERAQGLILVCVFIGFLLENFPPHRNLQKEGVTKAVMLQVKHKQICSSIRPDWRLAKLLSHCVRVIRISPWSRSQSSCDEGISSSPLLPILNRFSQARSLTSRAPGDANSKTYLRREIPTPSRAIE